MIELNLRKTNGDICPPIYMNPVNVTIHFQFNKDKNFLKVNLPKNCKGEIILPDSRKHDLSPGGNVFQYK